MGCGMNIVKFTLFVFNLICAVSFLSFTAINFLSVEIIPRRRNKKNQKQKTTENSMQFCIVVFMCTCVCLFRVSFKSSFIIRLLIDFFRLLDDNEKTCYRNLI